MLYRTCIKLLQCVIKLARFCPYQKAFQGLTALFHVYVYLFQTSFETLILNHLLYLVPISDRFKWFSQLQISQKNSYQISMSFSHASNFIITGTYKNRLFLFETLFTGFVFFLLMFVGILPSFVRSHAQI